MDDLFTMINKMRMTPRYLAWSLLVLYCTSSVVSGARERLRNGAASPFSTMDVTPLERRSLRSLLREQKTFPIPVFSYHMTIVDRDVKLDDFESHLLRITMAHLQTATGAALSSGTSSTLRDIRVDNFHLGANLHRAFTGENLETGEPEALVRCSFTGSVYLSVYGDATTAETEEDGFQQQEELDQIIEGALSNKDLLLQRFSSDSVLNIIEDLTVSVEEPNRQRQKIDASPSWGSDYQSWQFDVRCASCGHLSQQGAKGGQLGLPKTTTQASARRSKLWGEHATWMTTVLLRGLQDLRRSSCRPGKSSKT
eukprot:scaffold3856_cov169-Amphora_coffeaeformis.AAC.6